MSRKSWDFEYKEYKYNESGFDTCLLRRVCPRLITKHAKQNQQNPNGGIIHKEGTVDMSNVMLVLNGKPVRVGFEVKDGKKIRVAKTADGTVAID